MIIKFCPYPSHFFINIKSVSTSGLLVICTNVIVNMAENKDNEGGKESSKPKGIMKQEQSIRFAPDIIPGKRGLSEDEDDVPSDIVIRMRDSTV